MSRLGGETRILYAEPMLAAPLTRVIDVIFTQVKVDVLVPRSSNLQERLNVWDQAVQEVFEAMLRRGEVI